MWTRRPRRHRGVALAVAIGLLASGCSGGNDEDHRSEPTATTTPLEPGEPTSAEAAGLVPIEQWREQQDRYLQFAASGDIDPSSPLSILAHLESGNRGGIPADVSSATAQSFGAIFDKIDSFEDTSDFDLNRLLTLLLRGRDQLTIDLVDAIEARVLAYKYWWTEPTPEGVVDDQYYWSENHQVIFLANEYIAGQTFPDEVFTNAQMTGSEHQEHARERLLRWIDWRARFGFSEWLSNVYWTEDMMGLLLLAEFARDDELARLASMTLDMMFVELASHLRAGTFGTTHGRSYMKDKLSGPDEDTYSTAKLAFDQTPGDYVSADSATLLAVAQRYRPPEVARRIAASSDTGVFRSRAGLPLEPSAPIAPDAQAPEGLSFEGEEGLMAWWGMGAQFAWQVAPLSLETVRDLDLFETVNFQKASGLAPIVADIDDDGARDLAHSLAVQINPGLLSQVDTYTWRSPAVMLSTAQDWRPGQRGEQNHTGQATLDADALVFVQHPREGVPDAQDPNAREGYWTGDGAMPRAAQYENVSVSIFAPQYDGGDGIGDGAYSFDYEPYTHAYFPTERFDEVVTSSGWTIGRKGDGFVALWSHRPTSWRTYDTDAEYTAGLSEPFDLVAGGGPDNVWITEVATVSDYAEADDPFGAFVAAITGAEIVVSEPPCAAATPCPSASPGTGALVRYESPSQGTVTFGWAPGTAEALPPLEVDGAERQLHPDGFRWDSPYAESRWDSGVYRVSYGGATLDLDFPGSTRRSSI